MAADGGRLAVGSRILRNETNKYSCFQTDEYAPRCQERGFDPSANSKQHGNVLAHLGEQRWLGFGVKLCLAACPV